MRLEPLARVSTPFSAPATVTVPEAKERSMGRVYDGIDERMAAWIGRQPVFFVATAPETGGRVNLSPKGLDDTFAILDEHTVAYFDLGGSGAETIAHLRQNGRITIMFCSFAGPPRILRIYGTGRTLYPGDPRYEDLRHHFPDLRARDIIQVEVERVADSCGYGVPEMELVGQRTRLNEFIDTRTDEQLAAYRIEHNQVSIDGLPAIDVAQASAGASASAGANG
jgi:hypothetical protein